MEQKTVTIGNEQMVIQALPAMEGLRVGQRIAKILGGISDGVGETLTNDIMLLPINPGKMVSGIIDRLDSDTPQFIQKLVADSVVKPAMDFDAFELRFSAKWNDLADLLVAIVELNGYSDFLKKRIQDPLKDLFSTKENTTTQDSTP